MTLPLPNDEANRRLIAAVHPETWKNPEPRGKYNLVVIGAGTAGLVTAAACAGLGGRVALVERHWMGGDCLNTGCVPSKALLHRAKLRAISGSGDFALGMERVREARAAIAPEPFVSYYDIAGISGLFAEAGFALSEHLTPALAQVRYFDGRTDGLKAGKVLNMIRMVRH